MWLMNRNWSAFTGMAAVAILVFTFGLSTALGASGAAARVQPASGHLNLQWPEGLAVDSSGNVYVADYDAHHVLKLSSHGKLLATWGTKGTGFGQFLSPAYIAINRHGRVYVSDENANRVEIFNRSGGFRAIWPCPDGPHSFVCDGYVGGPFFLHPNGIAIDATGSVYIADTGNRRVERFSSSGKALGIAAATMPNDADSPQTIAIDPKGDLNILVFPSGYLYVVTPDGHYVHSKRVRMDQANGAITIDSNGTMYVADGRVSGVRKFDATGKEIADWGGYGSDSTHFNNPHGIAVDRHGNVYVSDTGNHRIVKLSAAGQVLAIWK